MGNKKELRKMTQTEKAILNARGEAIITMGVIIMAVSMLMAIVAIAMGNTKEVFGFLLFAFAYLGGAALFSYKYQKTPGFIILGVIGILLTIGSAVLYIINK